MRERGPNAGIGSAGAPAGRQQEMRSRSQRMHSLRALPLPGLPFMVTVARFAMSYLEKLTCRGPVTACGRPHAV